MKLSEVLQAAGRYKPRKRVGRGTGSGHGKTSTRGTKGYYARAGNSRRFKYEGGQNPLLARIPKRGFTNPFRQLYQVVNVSSLMLFEDGQKVDAKALAEAGLIEDPRKPVKVLGDGELKKKLTVVASKFSASAAQKIAQAGGTAETA